MVCALHNLILTITTILKNAIFKEEYDERLTVCSSYT